ncbi:MAG: amidohydrolase family protein [Pseudoruegeria sp.]
MINFDCHAHIYENVTAVPDARYMPPSPAPLSKWLELQGRHGIKGGVIVQVSFLGFDNSELCTALAKLDPKRFAGVAVVPLDVQDDTLDCLVAAGVRGVRWNLVRRKDLPDLTSATAQMFLGKLRQRNLHLEVHLEGPRLAPVLARVTDQGVRIVVDHFGLPSEQSPKQDPLIMATESLHDTSMLYFKFSAHYRTSFALSDHASALLYKLEDDHVVWGSDWPHTQHETETSFTSVQSLIEGFGLKSDRSAVHDLYGIVIERGES